MAGSSGLDARTVVDGDPSPSRGDAELLRVCQESLANVVRHARAQRVAVTLTYLPEQVRLDVRDNGVGFDPEVAAEGHGLPGCASASPAPGGTLEIETREGAYSKLGVTDRVAAVRVAISRGLL